MSSPPESRKRRRPSFTTLIVTGVILGILTGLFFGDSCAVLEPIGDAYIGLLQMTVLPFIIVSLVVNIGRLETATARTLATRGVVVLLVLWGIGLAVVAVLPLAYPTLETGSFFSTSLLHPRERIDFLSMYIPSNPFHAMANNVVPAVVIFSLGVGIALLHQENKERLLGPLAVAVPVLTRLNKAMVRLTPIGLFAISASAAGTMTISEFGRLQAYLLAQIAGALLLALWLLPMLISALTPLSYREVVGGAKNALLTGFATGNVLIILPLLTENVKTMFRKHGLDKPDMEQTIGVVLPVAFAFPNLGKLLSLVFIPFAAWASGAPIDAGQYPLFLVSGLLTFFGSTSLAIPYLLDLMRLPSDYFQLFLISGIVLGRLGTIVAAMHLVTLTIICTGAMHGELRVQRKRVVSSVAMAAIGAAIVLVSIRAYLDNALTGKFDTAEIILNMKLVGEPVEATVLREAAPNPVPLQPGESLADRVRRRSVLRVGYHDSSLPFSYFNANDDLVGFDIDVAHQLAAELGTTLEFVPVDRTRLAEQLAQDHFDIVMCGIAMTTPRLSEIEFADSYLDVHLALIVPDYRRRQFDTIEEIRAMGSIRIGLPAYDYLAGLLQPAVPEVDFTPIDDPTDFFESRLPMEAMIGSAEAGSVWTLMYPGFAVVRPGERPFAVPLAYPIGNGDARLKRIVSRWIELKRKDGTLDRIHDHWILGGVQEEGPKRWSIMRDVLGWGEARMLHEPGRPAG